MLKLGSKVYLLLRNNGKPQTSKAITLGDETPNYGPRWGKLEHQFPVVVNLAYDLSLTHMITHYKDISKE